MDVARAWTAGGTCIQSVSGRKKRQFPNSYLLWSDPSATSWVTAQSPRQWTALFPSSPFRSFVFLHEREKLTKCFYYFSLIWVSEFPSFSDDQLFIQGE